jgi:TRAP-type C4-dicarboxylate transport system permease small subunit
MITFWEVVTSLLVGLFFGFLFVWANKKAMVNYKKEYEEWWTPRRYRIFFVIVTIVITFLRILVYIIT